MNCVLICDTRERAIQDSINGEFTKPANFAKTKGTMKCEVRQVSVGDYAIEMDGNLVAIIERKTLKDYAASFKDNRHANKAKLINARNITGCKIYYIIEGSLNPDYETKYAGINYKNILASIHDLMICDDIFIIRTHDGQHTARELRMLCESYLRSPAKPKTLIEHEGDEFSEDEILAIGRKYKRYVEKKIEEHKQKHAKLQAQPQNESSETKHEWQYVHPIDGVIGPVIPTLDELIDHIQFKQMIIAGSATDVEPEQKDSARSPISFEEMQNKAKLTPAEKLVKCRVDAWKSLPGIGNNTAIHLASKYTLAEWIRGEISEAEAASFTVNGRKNKKVSNLLCSEPSKDDQISILAATNGLTKITSAEIMNQCSLADLLGDFDYSKVTYGTKGTKLTKQRVGRIKLFLTEKNQN